MVEKALKFTPRLSPQRIWKGEGAKKRNNGKES